MLIQGNASRVILRALNPEDASALAALRGNDEVARYQGWESFTEDDARTLIAQATARGPDVPGHWYQLGVALALGGELVGDCALKCPTSDQSQAEIGFTIGREHWGRGYASEAVSTLVEWLFNERGKRRTFAVTDGRNFGAHRLLRKLDFQRDPLFDRVVWFKGEFGPECVWAKSAGAR